MQDDLSFPNPDVKAQVAFANQFSTAKVGLVESGTEKGNYGDGGERGYVHFKLDRCRPRLPYIQGVSAASFTIFVVVNKKGRQGHLC